MIDIVYYRNFLKSAKCLPKSQQKKFANLLVALKANPFHPLLHAKYLSGELAGFLSFRISRDWRVIFKFINPETIHLIGVKHRKDIYKN
ncbi:hypothetical protein HY227_01890 [Candidatus Wolfebacteria bacterium]|nr:hypothetical protein [Candidatus Wolfebacteria bacterium]